MQPQIRTIGETIYFSFNTVNPDAAGSPPITLVSGAVGLLRGGSTTAETTGVSLTVDVGGVVGRHVVAIRTSTAGFKPNVDYSVVITAGTVNGNNVRDFIGGFRLTAVPDQGGMNTAYRFLYGKSSLAGIGDSYMSQVAAYRGVMDCLIADGRFPMRGENVLIDGMNPFSTKGGAVQPGVRVPVPPGSTFPGTSVVNRQYYSAESTWSGTLGNGNAFTPCVFGNDAAADNGGYLNPNLLPTDIGAIDVFLSYIGTPNSVTAIRNRIRRDVSLGVVDAPTFNASLASGYAANHYTLTALGGASGSIDMIAQLQANMSSQVWLQLGYGAVALDRAVGIVYGSVIGIGGAGVANFSSAATPPAGISFTDDQIHAWFEAQAATGYPVDTLIANVGINDGEGADITASYLTMLNRWVSIGQQYTTERFGVLCFTPAPYIGLSNVDKTAATAAKRDQIAAAVELFGDPTRVQLIDVHQKMVEQHGSVMDWGPVYLDVNGTGYLHVSAAGAPAFGAAAYSAIRDVANDLAPTVKRAVERLNIVSSINDPAVILLSHQPVVTLLPSGNRILLVSALCQDKTGTLIDPNANTIELAVSDIEGNDLPTVPAVFTRDAIGVYSAEIELEPTHTAPTALNISAAATFGSQGAVSTSTVSVLPRQPVTIKVS